MAFFGTAFGGLHSLDTGITELHQAAFLNNEARVRDLLLAGANPNAIDADGETPLDVAARRGNVAIAKLLIDNGAKVNHIVEVNRMSMSLVPLVQRVRTILIRALDRGELRSVKLLLQRGADPFFCTKVQLMEFCKYHFLPKHKAHIAANPSLAAYVAKVHSAEYDEDRPDDFLAALKQVDDTLGTAIEAEDSVRQMILAVLARVERMRIATQAIMHAASQSTAHLEDLLGMTEMQIRDCEAYISEADLERCAIRSVTVPTGDDEADAEDFYDNEAQEVLQEEVNKFLSTRSQQRAFRMMLEATKASVDKLLNTYRTAGDLEPPTAAKALRRAAMCGNSADVGELLKHVASVDEADAGPKKRTALHWATIEKKPVVVAMLLKAGASPDLVDGDGKSARDYANAVGTKPIKELFAALSHPSSTEVAVGASVLECGDSKLPAAETGTPVETLATALTHKSSAATMPSATVPVGHCSVLKNSEAPVTDRRASVSANRQLLDAAERGDVAALHSALIAGANVRIRDPTGWTALHRAAAFGHTKFAEALLSEGADVHARTPGGATVLHMAANWGHAETARLLLSAGIDPHLKNVRGEVAADNARENGHTDVLGVLESYTSNLTVEV